MVRGEDSHERVAFGGAADVNCGEGNGGGGIAANWFGEDAFARCGRQLFLERGGLLRVGDAPDAIGRNQWPKARDGLLEHRLLADNVKELLGCARAAAWPETRAAASGEDDGVDGKFSEWHGRKEFNTEGTEDAETNFRPASRKLKDAP